MRHDSKTVLILFSALLCAFFLLGGCGGSSSSPPASSQPVGANLLWNTGQLQAKIAGDPDLVILDVRKDVTDTDGSITGVPGATYTPYDVEHIEGAHYLDFFVFGDPYPTAAGVQANIEAALSALGITTDTTICIYDTGIANPQGKTFFQLERQGCTDVHLLDGGLPVWKQVGGATSAVATPAPVPSVFIAQIDNTSYAELVQMKAIFDLVDAGSTDYTLTDYREPPLYYGHKICPDAIRHGHMPNCGLLDWHDLFDSSTGLFKTRAQIEAVSTAAGLDRNKKNVVICNKGWRTGVSYFALRYIGWSKSNIIHYVGGIREWTKEDPVAYPMESEACFDYMALMPDPGGTSSKWGKRWSGAFAQVGSEVFCMGGYILDPAAPPNPSLGQSIVTDRVQAYDIATDTWRDNLTVMPQPVAFSVGAADSAGNILVIGGLDAGGAILDTVYGYDPLLNGGLGAWADVTGVDPLPVGRFSYAAAAIGDTIYVCGGLTDTDTSVTANYSASVDAYDTTAAPGTKWTSLPVLPQARRCHTMVSIGSWLYVLGGFYYDDGQGTGVDLRDVWALDTTNLPAGWIPMTDMPMDLAGHVATVANGNIYVLSGWSMDGIKYDVIEFDPVADTSRCLCVNGRNACIGWPRYWYFIGSWGDLVASVGGYGGIPSQISGTPNSGFTQFHQAYVYDLSNTFDP